MKIQRNGGGADRLGLGLGDELSAMRSSRGYDRVLPRDSMFFGLEPALPPISLFFFLAGPVKKVSLSSPCTDGGRAAERKDGITGAAGWQWMGLRLCCAELFRAQPYPLQGYKGRSCPVDKTERREMGESLLHEWRGMR